MSSSRESSFGRKSKIAIAVSVQLIGAALFARGFFPAYKPPSGYGVPPTQVAQSRPFDRLVFVIIDALRSDLMFGTDSTMNFTQSLVRDGKALPYTALAQSPTVTLPRLKAMTTGTNPQFIDAVLNIAESSTGGAILEQTDTWLRQLLTSPYEERHDKQAVIKKKAMVYGDDTWLRLFPPAWFEDVDGVTSFYVTDTEIVDFNVTRHIDNVFFPQHPQDWDIVILHYLGLDHVGHLGGSKSAMMAPKQQQLDRVISRIFDSISIHDSASGKRTLLLVAGDHGMTDAGNHGGSSEAELSAALLLASPSFSGPRLNSGAEIVPEVVKQVDIVPTLAILFGTGIPPASIGVSIETALNVSFRLPDTAEIDTLRIEVALRDHATQLVTVLQGVVGGRPAVQSILGLEDVTEGDSIQAIINRLEIGDIRIVLRRSQKYLLSQFSGYYLPSMLLGLIILAIAALSIIWQAFSTRKKPRRLQDVLIVGLAIAQLASFGSTSFIEEEHEAWFFLGSSSLLILTISSSRGTRSQYLLGAALIRLFRGWSQNGQKAGLNMSFSVLLREKPWVCHISDLPGIYLMTTLDLFNSQSCSSIATSLIGVAGVLALTPMDRPFLYLETDMGFFKDRESRPQIIYGLLAFATIVSSFRCTKTEFFGKFRMSAMVLLRSVTKRENYPVLWVSLAASELFRTMDSSDHETVGDEAIEESNECHANGAILMAWLQLAFSKCAFFAFGGSNSLATVDLSNAYNGLRSFSLPIVTLLTFLSNFAGPITIALGFMHPISAHQTSRPTSSSRSTAYTTAYFALYLLVLCAIGTHFSEHLFVFTVFSPAVLYGFAWVFGFHLIMMAIEMVFW